VLAPAIGGSVGNAVTQLARAQGAKHAISSSTSHAKVQKARSLGFDEIVDLSGEKLSEAVRRITAEHGADLIIESTGGEVLSEALGSLAIEGTVITLGYSAGRKSTIDLTDLIWKRARMIGFSMMSQPQDAYTKAWDTIIGLLRSGAVKPFVAKTFPLSEAADALRHLVEDRPFGRVILTI
jgi:NADPH2:quinone reductase